MEEVNGGALAGRSDSTSRRLHCACERQQPTVTAHTALRVRHVATRPQTRRLENVAARAVVQEAAGVQVHRFVRRLVVERHQLRAQRPVRNRIEVTRVEPLAC